MHVCTVAAQGGADLLKAEVLVVQQQLYLLLLNGEVCAVDGKALTDAVCSLKDSV